MRDFLEGLWETLSPLLIVLLFFGLGASYALTRWSHQEQKEELAAQNTLIQDLVNTVTLQQGKLSELEEKIENLTPRVR